MYGVKLYCKSYLILFCFAFLVSILSYYLFIESVTLTGIKFQGNPNNRETILVLSDRSILMYRGIF